MTLEVLRYAAFTDAGRGGNPAGVVLDADALTAAELLAVAADVGYSETAFVVDDGTRLRYFSPLAEVAFCGHATVATAVARAERDGTGTWDVATAAGPISVHTQARPDGLTATLTSPPTSSRPADPDVAGAALAALGWTAERLDSAYPLHVANAGNDHLVVGLADLATLAAFDYDFEALGTLMADQGWTTVHCFVRTGAGQYRVRNAFPPGGVHEDPATGAAAAAFAGYLRELGMTTTATLHQGVEMGRPSVLGIELPDDRARVTGAASPLSPAGT